MGAREREGENNKPLQRGGLAIEVNSAAVAIIRSPIAVTTALAVGRNSQVVVVVVVVYAAD